MPVVKATTKDVCALFDLAKEMRDTADCVMSRIPFDAEAARQYMEYAISNEIFGIFIYYTEQGEAVGFMAGWTAPAWLNPNVKLAYDFGLYVKPSHKGSMIGLRLLKAYEKWAKESGVSVISIEVRADIDNSGAIRFLTGMGYKREGAPMFKEF